MSVKQWNMLLVLGLLLVLAGGAFALYENNKAAQQKKMQMEIARQQEEDARQKREAEHNAALAKEFEDFLNGFLEDVLKEAKAYKADRRVLTGLIKPENLRTPEYIEENYRLGEETLMRLHLQMDSVMAVFDNAEKRFQALADKYPSESQKTIRKNWREVKDKQAALYVAYFESEGDLLDAVQALLSFYHEKRDVLHIDPVSHYIAFDDPADQARHTQLRSDLDRLMEMQAELLR